MPRTEYNSFYNEGFGFVCKRCEKNFAAKQSGEKVKKPRYAREGEAESKQPKLSNSALAKWVDRLNGVLICPNCGITEVVDV